MQFAEDFAYLVFQAVRLRSRRLKVVEVGESFLVDSLESIFVFQTVEETYSSAALRMMLVAPRVKSVPSSMMRFSRGFSSTSATKVPVLLLLSLSV